MSTDQAMRALFCKAIEKTPGVTLETSSCFSVVKTMFSQKELRRLLYVSARSDQEAQRIILEYSEEVEEKLNPEFLFVNRNKVLWPTRRPRLLEGYRSSGKIFVALSERILLTGFHGQLVTCELSMFRKTLKPYHTQFDETCAAWGCETQDLKNFLDKNLLYKDFVNQVDVFQEERINTLYYDAKDRFLNADPPSTINTKRLSKGITEVGDYTVSVWKDDDDD